jgi:hypothetical protein
MSTGRATRLLVILIASYALIGCGSGTSTPTSGPPVPALLTGNWNLAGNRALAQYPLLSVALVVNGNQITANGDFMVQCSNSQGRTGGSFSLTGQIASDGTFQVAETPSGAQFDSIQLAISGTAPAAGTGTWTGTYSFTDLAGYTSCIVDQTGPFIATALAPFSGTYTGTLIEGTPASPIASISVSLSVSQGAAAPFPPSYFNSGYYLPLTATVAVSGSPCFTSGATNTLSASDIQGDRANLSFTMSDGSQAFIAAVFASPDESSLSMVLFSVFGGQCSGTGYAGTLTHQ